MTAGLSPRRFLVILLIRKAITEEHKAVPLLCSEVRCSLLDRVEVKHFLQRENGTHHGPEKTPTLRVAAYSKRLVCGTNARQVEKKLCPISSGKCSMAGMLRTKGRSPPSTSSSNCATALRITAVENQPSPTSTSTWRLHRRTDISAIEGGHFLSTIS